MGDKRHIPNNLHRNSVLKDVECNSPLLKCGLRTMTYFQGNSMKEKKGKTRDLY